MSERVRLFSNGEEYRTWNHNNCDTCVKRPTCFLEEAIAAACMLDGTVSLDVAARLGVPDDGRERWWCRELRTEGDPLPSAAAEMERAGASPLPGFEGAGL